MGMKKGGLKGPLDESAVRRAFETTLESFIQSNGRAPAGSREWDQLELSPCRKTVEKYLKVGINELLKESGHETVFRGRPSGGPWTPTRVREVALDSIVNFFRENHRAPGSREWESHRLRPSRPTVRAHLGFGINELLEELGFDPDNPAPPRYSADELIEFLIRYAREYGEPPRAHDLNAERPQRYPSFMVYYTHFDSFDQALQLAFPGFEGHRGYSRDFLCQKIRDFLREFGRTPYPYELDGRKRPPGYPNGRSFDRAFGIGYGTGVAACLATMGLAFAVPESKEWTPHLVLQQVKEKVVQHVAAHGSVPGSGQWDAIGYLPSRGAIRETLGKTFNELLADLGYTPNARTPRTYLDDELLDLLVRYNGEHEPPTADGFRAHSDRYPDPINYQRRFGTWDEALRLAGLEPNSGLMGRRIEAADGHICDSLGEAHIDNFLNANGVSHEKDICYPRHELWNRYGSRRCDFYLTDRNGQGVYVEYAGLFRTSEIYRQKMAEKESLAEDMDLRMIIVYPGQFERLPEIFLEWLA